MTRSLWDKSEEDLEKDTGSTAGKVGTAVGSQVKKQADDTTRAIVSQLFGIDTSKKDNKTTQSSQSSGQHTQQQTVQHAAQQAQQTPQSLEELAQQGQQNPQQQPSEQTIQTPPVQQQSPQQPQQPSQPVNFQEQMYTFIEPPSATAATYTDPQKQAEEERKKQELKSMHTQNYFHGTFGDFTNLQSQLTKDEELEKRKKEEKKKAEEEEEQRRKKEEEEQRKKELPAPTGKSSKAAMKAAKPGRNRMELDMAKKKTETYRGTVG